MYQYHNQYGNWLWDWATGDRFSAWNFNVSSDDGDKENAAHQRTLTGTCWGKRPRYTTQLTKKRQRTKTCKDAEFKPFVKGPITTPQAISVREDWSKPEERTTEKKKKRTSTLLLHGGSWSFVYTCEILYWRKRVAFLAFTSFHMRRTEGWRVWAYVLTCRVTVIFILGNSFRSWT